MDIHTPATPDLFQIKVPPPLDQRRRRRQRPISPPPCASCLVVLGECLGLAHSLVTVIHVMNKPSKWTQLSGDLLTSKPLKTRAQATNNTSPLTTATQSRRPPQPARPPARQRLQARSHIVHTCYICFIYQHLLICNVSPATKTKTLPNILGESLRTTTAKQSIFFLFFSLSRPDSSGGTLLRLCQSSLPFCRSDFIANFRPTPQ